MKEREGEGKDLTDKKVGGCGGMRRGIWWGSLAEH